MHGYEITHWDMDSLPGATTLRKTDPLSLPKQPSAASNQLLSWGRVLVSHSPLD